MPEPLDDETGQAQEARDPLLEYIAATRGTAESRAPKSVMAADDWRGLPYGAQGHTPCHYLWKLNSLKEGLEPAIQQVLQSARVRDASKITCEEAERQRGLLVEFSSKIDEILSEYPSLKRHPWSGVLNTRLTKQDGETLGKLAKSALDQAWLVEKARQGVAELTENADSAGVSEEVDVPEDEVSIRLLTKACAEIVTPQPELPRGLADAVRRIGRESVKAGVQALMVAREAWNKVPEQWRGDSAPPEEALAGYVEELRSAHHLLRGSITRGQIRTLLDVIRELHEQLDALARVTPATATALEVPTPRGIGLSTTLVEMADAVAEWPDEAVSLLSPALTEPEAHQEVAELLARLEALRVERSKLGMIMRIDHAPETVKEAQILDDILNNGPGFLGGMFSGDYRGAMASLKLMMPDKKPTKEEMGVAVTRLLRHMETREAFAADPALKRLMGAMASGLTSPLVSAAVITNWAYHYNEKLQAYGEDAKEIQRRTVMCGEWIRAATVVATNDREAARAKVVMDTVGSLSQYLRQPLEQGDAEQMTAAEFSDYIMDVGQAAKKALDLTRDWAVPHSTTLQSIVHSIAAVRAAREAESQIKPHEPALASISLLGRRILIGTDFPNDPIALTAAAVDFLENAQALQIPEGLIRWIAAGQISRRLEALKGAADILQSNLDELIRRQGELYSYGSIDVRLWAGPSPETLPLADVVGRLALASSNTGELEQYLDFLRSGDAARSETIPEVCLLVDVRLIEGGAVPAAYDYVLTSSVVKELIGDNPALAVGGLEALDKACLEVAWQSMNSAGGPDWAAKPRHKDIEK